MLPPSSFALRLALAAGLASIGALSAQEESGEGLGPGEDYDWIEDVGFLPETGLVAVAGDLATIDLEEGWTFLPDDQARFFVEELWGNPPDDTVLGVVMPPHDHIEMPDWAVIITYEDDGHVEDDEAASIDYGELLESMQSDTADGNDWLRENGYDTVELLGWAEQPHYDAATHKLFWAKRLHFQNGDEDTLNYDVRVLGREGVLSMNAVAGIDALADVREGSSMLLERTAFAEGQRYEDFKPGVDRVAAYGIGGLIAGKVLLKVGLFKGILLFLAKGWKLIALAVVGVGAFAKRLLGSRKSPT